MSKALFQLTPTAAARVRELLKNRQKPALGVRVLLKTRGCSGMAYALEYVDTPNPQDERVEDQGVLIYIDPKAVMFLVGTQMDYEDHGVRSGFLFRNPNEKGRCGCGESFRV